MTTLDAGIYTDPPPLGELIHSLEHGAAAIWYRPSVSPTEVSKLAAYFDGYPSVIVAPYQYQGAGGDLPAGRDMALVAWHKVRYCDTVSLPVAAVFGHDYAYEGSRSAAYRGEAPEAGAAL